MEATKNHKDFIDLDLIDKTDIRAILTAARTLEEEHLSGKHRELMRGKQLAMIFEKASTRTRVSFEVAINHLGGNALMLSSDQSQLGRGETVADTAQVLSRYVDVIMIRTYKHETLKELAEHATIPVINGLTDYSHPCQVLADILTFEEHIGSIEGKTIAWCGDYNNVATSWVHAANQLGFQFNIACPEEFAPLADLGEQVSVTNDPQEAVAEASCVLTDTWVSMGDQDADYKRGVLAPFQVNDELMDQAASGAIFMHCLPAHRGEEVTASVIDGPRSRVFDEAENRLHVQKAVMLWCLNLLDEV